MLVQASAAGVDGAGAVKQDNVFHTRGNQKFRDRRTGGARTAYHHSKFLHVFLHHLCGIHESGKHDDCRPVLIIMHDRYIECLDEPLFNSKAFRRGDILEIDAAEGGRNRLDGPHDLIGILSIEHDGPRIDIRSLLEDERLPFHHRECAVRTDVAETEHRRPVGNNRDAVLLHRQQSRVLRMFRKVKRRDTHARRIPEREVLFTRKFRAPFCLDARTLLLIGGQYLFRFRIHRNASILYM